MLGFGENSSTGLSSMRMMMPVTDSGSGSANRQFLLPPPHNKGNNASDQRASASSNVFHEKYNLPQDPESDGHTMRAKIMAHPLFPRLLTAYANCQKVGAPHEVAARLEDACAKSDFAAGAKTKRGCMGEDPGLDQFMEAYCEMLIKYEQELTKPFQEAMLFFSRIDSQLKALAGQTCSSGPEKGEACSNHIDPLAEDIELKTQLMQKYSGYLGSLRQEFLKKKKNGKLPKQARQLLLDWWSRHCKWPYPTEAQKLALAQATGLHLKQINNWFINQRKRHWKPCEDMQYIMMDSNTNSDLGMENAMCKPYPFDYMPMLL